MANVYLAECMPIDLAGRFINLLCLAKQRFSANKIQPKGSTHWNSQPQASATTSKFGHQEECIQWQYCGVRPCSQEQAKRQTFLCNATTKITNVKIQHQTSIQTSIQHQYKHQNLHWRPRMIRFSICQTKVNDAKRKVILSENLTQNVVLIAVLIFYLGSVT